MSDKYYKVHPDYWAYESLLDSFYDQILESLPVDLDDMLEPCEREELAEAEAKMKLAPYTWELVEDE